MTRAAIKHAEEALRTAMLTADVDALDRLIDDDLLFLAPNGDLARKEEDLENYRSKAQTITRHEPRSLTIALFGEDIGVATVVVDLEGTFRGNAFAGAFRYIRTWRRSEAGAWRIIAGAVSATS